MRAHFVKMAEKESPPNKMNSEIDVLCTSLRKKSNFKKKYSHTDLHTFAIKASVGVKYMQMKVDENR